MLEATKSKIVWLFLLLSFYSLPIFAQDDDKAVISLADEMYGYGDRKDALDIYKQAVEANPKSVRGNYMIGICYLETIHRERAVPYLTKAYELDHNVSPDILYQIGRSLQYANRFDDAIDYYGKYEKAIGGQTFPKTGPTKDEVQKKILKKIEECQNGKELMASPTDLRLESVGSIVNSEYAEYSPIVTPDENIMYFTSRRQGSTGGLKDRDNEFFEDIYVTKKVDSNWTAPKNLGAPVNSEFHDGCIGLSPDGTELYVFKEEHNGDIYVSFQDKAGKWSVPKPLEGKVNSKYTESNLHISADGKLMFLTSNRAGTLGGFDIYLSTQDAKGKWAEPVNVGPKINTQYSEMSPFFDQSTGTLYFSSAGHKTMGGYDIFKSVYDSTAKEWGEPTNIGYPVNTSDDNIFYQVAAGGKRGYYASVQEIGEGEKDIYLVRVPQKVNPIAKEEKKEEIVKDSVATNDTTAIAANTPADSLSEKPSENKEKVSELFSTTVKGIIKDKETDAPIAGATIQVKDKAGKIVKSVTTDAEGLYSLDLTSIKPGSEFSVVYKSAGYTTEKRVLKPNSSEVETVFDVNLGKPGTKEKPAPKTFATTVKGRIVDEASGEPLQATIQVTNKAGKVIKSVKTNTDGTYSLDLESIPAGTEYSIMFKSNGYAYEMRKFKPKETNPEMLMDVSLHKVRVGMVRILRNIYFDYDKTTLKPSSFEELNELVAMMAKSPTMTFEINGHTDNFGSTEYNMALSRKRALAVVNYLVSKGVDRSRLTPVGYGERKPLATNDDETEGRELNRRTEFKVITK